MKYPSRSLPLVMQLNYSSEHLLLRMGQPGLFHRGNKASPEPRGTLIPISCWEYAWSTLAICFYYQCS